MKKFFLGSIAGSMSMLFAWMYIFRWSILEGFANALDNIISEKRSMNRMEHHEHLARAKQRTKSARAASTR